MTKKKHVLYRPEFPRSNTYDPNWVMDNQMGPNALWLTEWLCSCMDLKPGMRVLDLGCGKAVSSIFLAREFGLMVWAMDLWVSADENWKRVCDQNQQDRVFPVHAEAHALPLAAEFFDAIVSVDAYQYFGTDELYLGYLRRFLRPDGQIGVVIPGLMQPLGEGIPEHLMRRQSNGHVFWVDENICFHTAEWWRELWERSNRVDVLVADAQTDGWRDWRDFEITLEQVGKNVFPSVAETLDADRGRYLGFVRLLGIGKGEVDAFNLYDPDLLAKVESGRV